MKGGAVVFVVCLAVVGLAIAPAAAGLGSSQSADGEASAMGDELSTFVHTNTANAGFSVDEGMFEAKYEAADDEERAALLAERADGHESTIAELEDEAATLENGEDLDPAEYNARMTRLAVSLNAVDTSLNHTADRAAAVDGVAPEAIQELRANASALAGPEVAEHAAGIQGVEPPRGPPDDAGPGAGNETPGVADDAGPPEEAGNASDGGDDAGPPDDDTGENNETVPDDPAAADPETTTDEEADSSGEPDSDDTDAEEAHEDGDDGEDDDD